MAVLRSLLRTPGFTAVGVLTLALGIGGATTIFSVVDTVLLRPLPYPDSDALVVVHRVTDTRDDASLAPANFLDLQAAVTEVEAMAGYREEPTDLLADGPPMRVPAIQTTATFFDVLRARPLIGRFYDETDRAGGAVVISEGLWDRHFARRADVIGRSLRVNGVTTPIVGVAPASLRHPLVADVWTLSPEPVPLSPLPVDDLTTERDIGYFGAIARRAPGATLARVNDALDRVGQQLARDFPEANRGETYRARPLQSDLVTDVRGGLLALVGVVCCVLLIACANVSGLHIARGAARRRDLAICASLGATRARLARQVVAECLALAAAGGLAGLLLAAWLLDAVVLLAASALPRLEEVRLDWRVAVAGILVTTIAGLVAAVTPAVQAARPDVIEDLREGSRGTPRRTRLRDGLVVGEVALALILLVGAGLSAASLLRLRQVDPGIHTSQLVTVTLPLPTARYGEAEQRRFYKEVLDRVRVVPATASAALAFPLPLTGSSASIGIEIEGVAREPQAGPPLADLNAVSPGYFGAAGLRLIRGRLFDHRDVNGQLPVAVVNERLARHFTGDPLGQRINLGEWVTVVGIVSDARRRLTAEPNPALYLPSDQFVLPYMSLLVRTAAPAGAVAGTVKAAVQAVDPDLPIGEVRTIEQILDAVTESRRLGTGLVLAFATLALLLAAVGLYGLMSFLVSQRSQEMGIRLALGARRGQVAGLVIGQGLRLAAIGVAAGLVALGLGGRIVAGVLYETSPTEPAIVVSLATLLLTVAAAACYVPARRAMRVDPAQALRGE